MIIDRLENFYAERSRPRKNINVFRASSAGYCERRLGYDKLGIIGDPITPRRAAVFRHGHIIDGALKADMAAVLGDRFINLDDLPVNECWIEGVRITFTPDGAFQTDTGEIGIVEIKTMSDFGFERALKGEIDRSYLCQAWTYAYGTSFNPVVFVCYRKETSAFCEVVFDRRESATVVVQRFGGDPKELYINDPLLVAEIRTPFDRSVEEEVRGKFRRLAALTSETELAPRLSKNDRGEPIVKTETVKAQGKEKAAPLEAQYGKPVSQSGSWFTFETGRKIANFPCSYCGHIRRCLGAQLDFTESNKPIWVLS